MEQNTQAAAPGPHIVLRRAEVERRVGLSRSRIYARMAAGDFPPPIQLGSGRAVGWLESDINAWLDRQIQAAEGRKAYWTGSK
jgi:prophage regulatory protein